MNPVLPKKAEAVSDWEPVTIDPGSDVFVLPATPNQTRFWALDQLQPGNPALNMPLAWSCRGQVDAELVAASLSELVRRHESLRTTFEVVDGKLSQIIQSPFVVPLPFEDLTTLPVEERKDRAEEITRREARTHMDMKRGPLFFGRLIRMDSKEHILLVTIHHSVCDGWSNGVILKDFAAIYDGKVRKAAPNLPELDIQFGDFAVWLDDWRKSDAPGKSLEYWRRTLGRDFTPLRIKHDAPITQSDGRGDIETLLLTSKLLQDAKAFCATEGVTNYMLLLAVYTMVLYHLTGQSDILIGSPCANRRPGTENLIGPFSNPQVFRMKIGQGDTFGSVLDRVRTWTAGAIANQDLPFEDIVEDAYFTGEHNQINLQFYFVYQRAFMQEQHITGMDIVPIRSVSPGATFELMLSIVERAEGQRLQLEFNPENFQVSTIHRILGLYKRILEVGISDASRRVDELEILEDNERRVVVEEWNQTSTDFGSFEPLHRTVEQRAVQTPGRTAVVCNGQQWSYQQLNEYGNQVAHYLRGKKIGDGALVAVCLERSLEMLGVVLGIFKAGAAYLPLDPGNPVERLDQTIADAQAALLITEESLVSHLLTETPVLSREAATALWAQESKANVEGVRTLPQSLAYVIYTSGSTGKPKGVAVEHGALMNLLLSMQREPGMNASDTLVSITTLSFDISALELFLPLLTGARLVIATADQARDGNQLLALLEDARATVLQATPSQWRQLVDSGWHGKPELKVLCGGETLPRDLAESLRKSGKEVWNLYGPTETTIWSSATRVGQGAVRVGPPIANTQFYVLDERLKPVPVGVIGELYIGGKGLARGYWRRPDLTAQSFLTNPFGTGRIYRTGDLARWNSDGRIDLLGRNDSQVKIRGFRIELGEIETELVSHPTVRDAVVMAIDDEQGHKRLAAWVDTETPEPPLDLSVRLLAQLSERLPEYMLPVAITVLSSLPRTPNGKIDRKSLPAPDFVTQSRHALVKPRNEVERKLHQIWQEVLGLDEISVLANFFELGGNSLMILRLISRVNTAFQSVLPIPIIYTAPTIEKMAHVLGRKEEKDFVLALQPSGWRPPLFMIQSYHLYRTLPAALGVEQPFYGVRELELGDRPFPYTLDSLVRSYVQHIREVQPHGPYYLGGFCFFALLAFAVASELESQGEEVAFLGLIDANCPYYWCSKAPEPGVRNRFSTVLRYHAGQIKKASPLAGLVYAGQFMAKKLWNRWLNFFLWARHKAYSFYMVKGLQLPRILRNKTIVTRVAVRMHKPKPIQADIYLFPAADQPYPDNFDQKLGWGEMTQGQVQTIWLPGSHEDMFLKSNILVMAKELRQIMNDVMVSRSKAPDGVAK